MSTLVVGVRLHDGRYHGTEWPPAPARLFQALLAGAGIGGPLGTDADRALRWLEAREAPVVAAPLAQRARRRVMFYMPNNDSDRVDGDPLRMGKIRTATKVSMPFVFEAETPFFYAWSLGSAEEDREGSRRICELAEGLYQLGRGVDMAWAWGEVLNGQELERRFTDYPGGVYRPSAGRSASTLACPAPGSLDSLKDRYRAYSRRFEYTRRGNALTVVFRQPPRPRFRRVPYDSVPWRASYELREPTAESSFARWPLARAPELVVSLRDAAVDRLSRTLPGRKNDIERVLVGRRPDGTNGGPAADRVRIVPLPSIGHPHADCAIRRVLVEVPATCPIAARDVDWAFSGLDIIGRETGEAHAVVVPASEVGFVRHYGIDAPARVWRTMTPAALPQGARRRRIDPARSRTDAKGGDERVSERARAALAVAQALRHAEVRARASHIRLQREPFEAKGDRAEGFARDARFAKERLWHVEITFDEPVGGPLVIGDGRFLGLGVMAPVPKAEGLQLLLVESGLVGNADPVHIAHALRRAVMARVQGILGDARPLPPFFGGHERDGSPARTESHPHLAFAFDPGFSRLLVAAPHVLDRRAPTREERGHLEVLEKALQGFRELRAGRAGCLTLRRVPLFADADALTAPSRVWSSVTPYQVTRHAKRIRAEEVLAMDVRSECRRYGLPEPCAIEPLALRGVSGVGLVGSVKLIFAVAVEGPLLLGRSRHIGGGLFLGGAFRTG